MNNIVKRNYLKGNLLSVLLGIAALLSIIGSIAVLLSSYWETEYLPSELPSDPCVTQECKDQMYYLNLFNVN